jgi:UDP-N-acetyl-D-mannosaminuronic acid dehydrogenase
MSSINKNICVIGLGYIGLPTAALLANRGYSVNGIDIVQEVVDTINQGMIHIIEPELESYVKTAVSSRKLVANTEPQVSDVYIIAVPTPFYPTNSAGAIPKPNLEYVFAAAKKIAPLLKNNDVVILESTSPVGTTLAIESLITDLIGTKIKVHYAHCPERVLPGQIMRELVENDRIVGGTTIEATKIVADFYQSFVKGSVLQTTASTAEMAKLTENSFRDVNIAFANELSILCDTFGIDVSELIRMANRHPRVNILTPGCGVGGHCIAVDPWFLVSAEPEKARLIRAARDVNNSKQDWVVKKVQLAANKFVEAQHQQPKIICFGLAFKPNIDDLRESPALEIYHNLKKLGFNVQAVEPNIQNHSSVNLIDFKKALSEGDILVLLVKHKEFVTELFNIEKIVLDFCGVKDVTSRS